MSERPAVEVCGVSRVFHTEAGEVVALRDIDLTLTSGEFVAIMGPSGSGKSTLLHLVAGLDRPTSGAVHLEGQALDALDDDRLTLLRRRRIGMVFQAYNLVDVLTAAENVALPLLLDGVPEAEARRRADEALHRVGMASGTGRLPARLSGGEQQRVAIARAIIFQPRLLLADEPTGQLDSAAGDAIVTLLRQLVQERRQTVLLVTHDARHAARADRVLRLRDGRLTEEQRLAAPGKTLDDILGGLGGLDE
ncbi:MAG: ABC transporter ATP-binding protein [Gemmataceae bacterium]